VKVLLFTAHAKLQNPATAEHPVDEFVLNTDTTRPVLLALTTDRPGRNVHLMSFSAANLMRWARSIRARPRWRLAPVTIPGRTDNSLESGSGCYRGGQEVPAVTTLYMLLTMAAYSGPCSFWAEITWRTRRE
jgi:hypothetical protein